MTISKRDMEIYKLATRGDLSMVEIAMRHGLTRQSIYTIVDTVQKQLGKKPIVRKKQLYPFRVNQFFVTEQQHQSIEDVPEKTFSAKMRHIIEFSINHHWQESDNWSDVDDEKYPIREGAFYINRVHKQVLDLAPGKNVSKKLRYIINFYVNNQEK